jgi:hypothetical protein
VPEEVIEKAVLVVSELTTNAVKHSGRTLEDPPPWAVRPRVRRFIMTLWCLPDHVQIYVYDDDRRPPIGQSPTPDGAGGRGLVLVEELSDRWGYLYPTPHADSGKAVWAQLALPRNPNPTDLAGNGQSVAPPGGQDRAYWRNDPATMHRAIRRLQEGQPHGIAGA